MAEISHKKALAGERGLSDEWFPLVRWQRKTRPGLPLSDTPGMGALSSFKGGGLVQLPFLPNGQEDACPNIGQGTNGHRMTLAFSSFAPVVLPGPGFPSPTAVSKLIKRVAPGLNAAQSSMGFLVRPALVENRRGASKSLQAAGALIAVPVVTHFRQQARSETCSSSRQRQEELAVGMAQKKALNLLVILIDLFEERFQLGHQGQH